HFLWLRFRGWKKPRPQTRSREHGSLDSNHFPSTALNRKPFKQRLFAMSMPNRRVAARRPGSPRSHRGHGNFTEAGVLCASLCTPCLRVVNKELEFLLSLAAPQLVGIPRVARSLSTISLS